MYEHKLLTSHDRLLRKPDWDTGMRFCISHHHCNLWLIRRSRSLHIHNVSEIGLKFSPSDFLMRRIWLLLHSSGKDLVTNISLKISNIINLHLVDKNLIILYSTPSNPGAEFRLTESIAIFNSRKSNGASRKSLVDTVKNGIYWNPKRAHIVYCTLYIIRNFIEIHIFIVIYICLSIYFLKFLLCSRNMSKTSCSWFQQIF